MFRIWSPKGKVALAAFGLALSCAAQAQVAIFQENFSAGLGQFTATGTVDTSSGAAVIRGCFSCTDGAIVSNAISTVGFSSLRLSYDRTTTGLDSGEMGVVAYAVNGGTWTAIESVTNASGRVTFNLPAALANQSSVRLRWRVDASQTTETFTVDNILLEGTSSTGGTNPYAKGPDPTSTSLEATTGPFTYATATVSRTAASGYGGGTIYYPTNVSGTFGAIAVVPGYTALQSSINWWGPRLASNGFIVFTIDTNDIHDLPDARATELIAALNQLKTFNATAGHPIYGKVDVSRLAVMGWSYGGGGTLIAAQDNPTLKAAIPFAPKTLSQTNFSTIQPPTLIIGCQSDTTAPPASWAIPFYNSITVDKAYLEISGGSHSCATSSTTAADKTIEGKYGVSWMKRFVDNDTRYSPYLCGAPHQADLSNSVVSDYRSNCPY